jgi:hypothetical protein
MKEQNTLKTNVTRFMALMTMLAATSTALAAGPALQGSLSLRGLTPQELKDYSLGNIQIASGLNTVGIGQPAYFDALVNYAVPTADITNVLFTLTVKPVGSAAVMAASPLGTNVPPGKIADRINQAGSPVFKVAGRSMLVPDIVGQYTVSITIQTGNSGSTNFVQVINAARYMGIYTCKLCHSGGVIASNIFSTYQYTLHAHAFEDAIDGVSTDHFSKNCISCHVLGYDTNSLANNGGFDDYWKTNGWVFPTNFNSGNFSAMPADLQNTANVQCENCHGPGSEHAMNIGNTALISKSLAASDCTQCHDSLTHHSKTAEWNNSLHARPTRTPSGTASRNNCVRCHTATGFAQYIESGGTNTYVTNVVYEAITCAACHDPHDAKNPHQLRTETVYTLPEGTTVTNAGLGALCMNCHHSRNGSATNNVAKYIIGAPTWAGGSSFGPHDSTAGDMIEGVNGIDYGTKIPSGAHSYSISNVCVGCHMQPVASTDPAFTKAGGHTFSMTYMDGATEIDKVDVCVKCHGPITTFDMVRKDYNGDGIIEGIQTEVNKLLDKLSTMLPNSTYRADGQYVADGLVKTSISTKTNWPVKFLNAGWNWQFVDVEGSHGIHNAPYAIGLLKASISDLSGDSNNDGLADWWQTTYFGSPNAANAAPNASPAGDGIPNWLKYALGLNPNIAGIVVPDGVVWANGNSIGGGTNTIHIYTAAEIAFDTDLNKTYQIQAVSTLGGGWQNIGTPIAGTGSAISYLTPTRDNVQQYYRVIINP